MNLEDIQENLKKRKLGYFNIWYTFDNTDIDDDYVNLKSINFCLLEMYYYIENNEISFDYNSAYKALKKKYSSYWNIKILHWEKINEASIKNYLEYRKSLNENKLKYQINLQKNLSQESVKYILDDGLIDSLNRYMQLSVSDPY